VLAVVGSAEESGGGDAGGDAGSDAAGGEEAEAQPAAEQPDATQDPDQDQPAETPLDQERVERDDAHAQAEQADTPAEPAEESAPESEQEPQQKPEQEPAEEPAQEPAQKQSDEAPRDEVAGATAGAAQSSGEQTVVRLPELGESVTEGTVTRWLKQVGDQVAADESLLEVSTDKVDTEIPSPAAGTLLEIKVNEDETVDVGAELAVIGSGDSAGAAPATDAPSPEQQAEEPAQEPAQESAPEPAPEPASEPAAEPDQPAAQESPAEPAPEQAQPAAEAAPAAGRDNSAYVTPLVRKMATQHGVDLSSLVGTGVGGRIRKQDVLDAAQKQGTDTTPTQPAAAAAAAAQPTTAPAPGAAAPGAPVPSPLRGKTEPMSRLRKVIAQRMVESLRVSAQLTTVVEVDVTSISRLRDSVKADFAAREGVKLSFMPFFAKAAIDALKAHPSLNA
jgi:2-oxoglutarate dehydrogenase E2 component (dihydrolipoamide succinyltransferase)